MNNNGLTNTFLSRDNPNFYQQQVFPSYPNAAVNCPRGPASCTLPDAWKQYATSEIAAFSPSFKTPRVQQGSLSLERELPGGVTGTLSYRDVPGADRIRHRQGKLRPPTSA